MSHHRLVDDAPIVLSDDDLASLIPWLLGVVFVVGVVAGWFAHVGWTLVAA